VKKKENKGGLLLSTRQEQSAVKFLTFCKSAPYVISKYKLKVLTSFSFLKKQKKKVRHNATLKKPIKVGLLSYSLLDFDVL